MTKEEILKAAGFPNTKEGVEAFYKEYDSPEVFFAKHGGSLSGAPHNGQPTADQFFSYGSHYNDSINVPMGNPYYAAEGGTPYYGGPIRPYEPGGVSPAGTMSANNNMSVNKKMSPEEWAKSNKDLGYEVAKNYNSSNIKYPAYVNPKEYAYDDSGALDKGYKKIGDVGKKVDYNKDTSYNPFNEYKYKEPVKVKQQTVKPWTPAGTTSEGYGLYTKNQDSKLGQFVYNQSEGKYVPLSTLQPNQSATSQTAMPAATQPTTPGVAPVVPPAVGQPVSQNFIKTPTQTTTNTQGKYGGYMAYGGGLQKYQGDKQGSQVTLTPQQVAAADQAFGRIDHYSIRGQDDENANTAYKAQIDSLYRNPKYDIVSKIDSLNKVYPTVNEGLEDVPFNTIFNPDKEYNKNLIYKKENISGASIPYMQKNEPQNLNKFENKANPYFKNSSYKEYGGDYMEDGGEDYNSPTNYGSFPAIQTGGVLNADNNMSYPMLEDGGRYNLLNLIKAASKKMKKAYGGDTVTQGGNSDNYGQGITDAFKKGIQNNTMMALMNEEEEGASYAVKQMGGPQLNPQNAAMQNMYQQRVDNMQSNVDQSGQNFMNASANLANSYNPNTKTSVKAADGIQVLLNKQTGKPFTAEEYDQYQKYFGKDGSKQTSTTSGNTKGNIYNYGPTQGTDYFPMNYRNRTKISKADDAMLRQLAANPTTNLKEYKNFNFGPFGRTKMKFGYKDIDPEFKPTGNVVNNVTNNENISKPKFGPGSDNNGRTNPTASVYPAGRNLLDMLPNAANFDKAPSGLSQPMNQEAPPNLSGDWNSMLNNKQLLPPNVGSKAYGGVFKYQMAGQFPNWGSPIGGAAAPTPTPQSAGFGQNPIMMNGATDKPAPFTSGKTSGFEGATGPEKEATVTQKRRAGFNKEAAVNWGLAGMNMASSILEQNQDRSAEQLADSQIAGNAFLAKPANAASYGDYNVNSGDFRENQKVPVQFPGNTAPTNNTGFAAYGGYMQEGGMQEQQPNPQQVMQGVATMLQQGAQPEQIAKQLVEMGIPQEQVMQLIQTVVQQLQGSQEEPQAMRYGGFAKGGQADEESYEDDLSDDKIAELRAQGYDVEYI